MIRAQPLPPTPARITVGFDLDQAIAQGRADFGAGKLIDLVLRVRGYPATLLRVCPLTDDQVIDEEPEGAPFALRVSARLPSTGQLLRWLLGLGANIEVLAPAELRQVLAGQVAKMGAIYPGTWGALPGKTRSKFDRGMSTGPKSEAGRRQAARNLKIARAALADPRFAELRSEAARRGRITRKLNAMRRRLRRMADSGDALALRLLGHM